MHRYGPQAMEVGLFAVCLEYILALIHYFSSLWTWASCLSHSTGSPCDSTGCASRVQFFIRGRGVSYGDKQKSSSVQSSGLSTIISMVKSREKSSIIP